MKSGSCREAYPEFWLCLKEQFAVPARESVVADAADQRDIMSAQAVRWYREQTPSERLVEAAPIVEVFFRLPGGGE